jgi:hypothetical protein
VTLYQDADTPALDIFRGVRLADGSAYLPPRCWMDLFQAISQVDITCKSFSLLKFYFSKAQFFK